MPRAAPRGSLHNMDPHHQTSDQQSLRLTEAAILAVQSNAQLVLPVLATLNHWDATAPSASKRLRDEWREIISTGQWHIALGMDDHAQQLRQASPLGRALTPQRRLEIIRACKGRNSST